MKEKLKKKVKTQKKNNKNNERTTQEFIKVVGVGGEVGQETKKKIQKFLLCF